MSGGITAIIPTLGAETLPATLRALRHDAPEARVRIVWQGVAGTEEAVRRDHDASIEWLRVARPIGFAAAVNRGLDGLTTPFVAVLNDDACIDPGWSAALLAALSAHSDLAAAQGRNLRHDGAIDGDGLGWNEHWQAIQIGHGQMASETEDRELFGVSATAAIYRRDALIELGGRDGMVFDERLDSFYEDVDLAVRLRRDGWAALRVSAATARHHGSFTTGRRPLRRWTMIHGNRWLVLARLLGRAVATVRGTALRRDLRDVAAALARADARHALGVALGWARAARRWRNFAHSGPPLVAPEVLRRFGAPHVHPTLHLPR